MKIALQAQSRKCQLIPSLSYGDASVTAEPSHASSGTLHSLTVLMQLVEHIVAASISKILPSKRSHKDPSESPTAPVVNLEAERKIKALEAQLARVKESSPLNDTMRSNTSLFRAMFSEITDITLEQNLQQVPDLLRAHL